MRILLSFAALAYCLAGSSACSDDRADQAAAGTVTVTVTGIEDAIGHDLAGVMFDGLETSNPGTRGIGGFGVEVDSDPFTTTQAISTPATVDRDIQFPSVSDEPLVVEPGDYTIMIWIADDLGPYSRWVPADSPGLGGCRVDVTVEEGRSTTVTVDGVPGWGGAAPRCSTR